jgi:aldehyde:ferredoxin oxidoreductase
VEYETLGLLGTNCGLSDPDDLAQLNYVANDLGVDTIETGAMLAVLMEAGLGAFGDAKFMADCLAEVGKGTEKGRLWAQGTARWASTTRSSGCRSSRSRRSAPTTHAWSKPPGSP